MYFQKNAKESASKYYKYLKERDKGVITYEVVARTPAKIEDVTGYFKLRLNGPKVAQPDYLQVQIADKVYDSSEIEIVSYSEKTKTLTIKPMGKLHKIVAECELNEMRVISDLKFLVKRVENWYEEFGSLISIPTTMPSVDYNEDDELLVGASEEQRRAIKGVLSNPFAYVWGAPGTGKTQFVLARLASLLVSQDKKILIAAPTNYAVEQALRGVLPVLKEVGIDIGNAVLRLGVSSDKFAREFPEVCESSKMAREIHKLQEQIESIKDLLKENEVILRQLDEYDLCQNEISTLKKHVDFLVPQNDDVQKIIEGRNVLASEIEELSRELTEEQNLANSIEDKIEKNKVELSGLYIARSSYQSRIKAFLNKKKIETIEADIERVVDAGAILNRDINSQNNKIKILKGKLDQLKVKNSLLEKDAELILIKIKDYCDGDIFIRQRVSHLTITNYMECLQPIVDELKQSLNNKQCELDSYDTSKSKIEIQEENNLLVNKLEELDEQYKDFSLDSKDRTEKCQIIAATIDTCLARVTPDMPLHFSHVFLDEAGYSNTIKAATLLSFGCPITLLGDHMQLPPVCEMDLKLFEEDEFRIVSYWAQSSLHIETALTDSVEMFTNQFLKGEEAPFEILKKYNLTHTFRFGRELAEVLADDVYDSSFTGNEACNTNIYCIDACKGPDDEKRTSSGEMYAIIEYCKKHQDEDIAVLSPYRDQVQLIKNGLRKNDIDSDFVSTIHRSQGQEWDTVLFSITDTQDMWFVNSFNKKSNGKKLISTAVSRAKKKLIIIADLKFWMKQDGQLIKKLIEVSEEIVK